MNLFLRSLLLFAATLLGGPAWSQEVYPNKPITWIVPNPAGGGADAAVRSIASVLSTKLGQQLVIDNRPGAGTMIGAGAAARSKPDGYTLLTGDVSTFATNGHLFKTAPYNALKDFTFVSLTSRYPLLLVAKQSLPANNLKELIGYAKANPGKLNFGTAGQGVPHHFALELFMEQTGTRFVHVPFRGSLAALQELLSGQVDLMFLDVASGHQFIQDQRLKVFGVASAHRFERLPEVPTLVEAGLKFEFNLWQGVAVPAGTPDEIVTRLSREFDKTLKDPGLRAKLLQIGAEPLTSTPEEFARYVRDESERWGKLIAQKQIKLE